MDNHLHVLRRLALRSSLLFGLTILLWVAGSAGVLTPPSLGADEEVTPYKAWLPNPEWTESDPEIRFHAARIVDALTEEPLPNAQLTGHPEDLALQRVVYAPALASARSNTDGIASMRSPGTMRIKHWKAEAPGYAPRVHFGYQPPTVIGLVRGAVVAGRLVGPTGRPVVGAVLDPFMGCRHAPSLGRVVTDDAGRFVLPRCDPGATEVWIRGPEGAARFMDVSEVVARSGYGRPIILGPTRLCTGVVLRADGTPAADVLIRAGTQPAADTTPPYAADGRTVHTRTDVRGRFTLPGLPAADEPVGLFVVPGEGPATWHAVPATSKAHLTIVLGGTPPEVLRAPAAARERVRARVQMDEQTRRVLFDPDLDDDAPRLGVVASRHEAEEVDLRELVSGGVQVWRDGPLALILEEGVFPFGAVEAESRTVAVQVRPSREIQILAPAVIDSVVLVSEGVEVAWPELAEGRFWTPWRGPVRVELWSHDVPWHVDVVIEDGEAPLRIDVAKQARPRRSQDSVVVAWRHADGRVPEDIHLTARVPTELEPFLTVYGATSPEDEIEGPCRVTLRGQGLHTLRADLEPGSHVLEWGPGVLEVVARAPGGQRLPCVVLVEGALHRDFAHDEALRIEGLPAGRVRVVATPLSVDHHGVAFEVELGSTPVRRTVTFPAR